MLTKRIALSLMFVVLGLATSLLADQNSDEPNDLDVVMRAFELRMARKADEAMGLLEKAVCENPENSPAQFELARLHFSTTMDSVSEYEGSLRQKQKMMKKKLETAQKAIKLAIKPDPANPRYHYWAGKIGTYLTVYDSHFITTMPAVPIRTIDFLKNYEKAIELKPDFYRARNELIGLYERLPWYLGGNKAKAQEHRKELEQLKPGPDDDENDLLSAPPKFLKTRIGVYDSRAIACAFAGSKWNKERLNAKMAEMEQAKAAGDTKKIKELDEWGNAQQHKLHRQGFSTAEVDDILEYIKDSLPGIAEDTNVINLVSKWDKETLKQYKSAEQADVTDRIVAEFNPTEKTLKTIEQLTNEKPIPLWKLEMMLKFGKH